jgi:two-component system, NarL family, sensor kinase
VRLPELRPLRGRGDPVATVVALIRVALLPVVVLGQHWTQPPRTDLELLEVAFEVATVYAALTLAVAIAGRRQIPLAWLAVLDLGLLSVMAYAAGGAAAHVRFAFAIPPIVAAFLARPRHAAVLAVASLGCFVAVAAVAPTVGEPEPARTAAAHAVDLAWRNALVVAMAAMLARRERRISDLAESRRALVAQSLRAEDRARRELAYALHDHVVQSLLSVGQDLGDAAKGRAGAIPRAREVLDATVLDLRDEIAHLHPHQLETIGVAAAIRQVAAQRAQTGGFAAHVAVADDVAGAHDHVLLAVARELLQNAAKHARATTVRVDVRRANGAVVLDYADDGCGFRRDAVDAAVRAGHIGLAACTERLEAIGGALEVRSVPGRGTSVRAVVPPEALLPSPAFL